MEGRCFESHDPQWIPRIRIARKQIADDEGDDNGNGTGSSQTLVDQANFDLVFWTESPFPTAFPIEVETCHDAAMAALHYLDQLDAHWGRQLRTVNKTERDGIFAGMRWQFPLVLSAWDTKCCALISDPDPTMLRLADHPGGHGVIAEKTYFRGAIKMDDKLLAELGFQQRWARARAEGDPERVKFSANLLVLQAAIFYIFTFQLADLFATYDHWGLDYTLPRFRQEGGVLQALIFQGSLQLWRNSKGEYKLVVEESNGKLVVLDDNMVCRPLFVGQMIGTDDTADRFGRFMRNGSTASTDLHDAPLTDRIMTLYHRTEHMRRGDAEWYWRGAWNRCKDHVPPVPFCVYKTTNDTRTPADNPEA
ncbi:hypothetical protein SLS62_001009 [Diatrype stigma]|uniref:Uncharacterized protein n=1 Tax=Diatrype stigma TaxID=117547 RepID=A0AAN9YS74_9PEZI